MSIGLSARQKASLWSEGETPWLGSGVSLFSPYPPDAKLLFNSRLTFFQPVPPPDLGASEPKNGEGLEASCTNHVPLANLPLPSIFVPSRLSQATRIIAVLHPHPLLPLGTDRMGAMMTQLEQAGDIGRRLHDRYFPWAINL